MRYVSVRSGYSDACLLLDADLNCRKTVAKTKPAIQSTVMFSTGDSCMKIVLFAVGCVALAVASVDGKESSLDLVPADPQNGFNFPYFLWTPAAHPASEHPFLIVESNNSGKNDDLQFHIDATRAHVVGNGIGPTVARVLGAPLLMPVFPRSESEWQIYTHALDSDSMHLSEDSRERIDLQLLNMVDDARTKLARDGGAVREKFVLVGFSASGTFSNRFSFIHPGRLIATVSGAVNAFPMLPVGELSGRELDYPLGVSNIESIAGKEFEKEKWRALPQMIFMGAIDDNDALQFHDAYSEQEREAVFEVLAEPMDQRWSKAQMVYLDQNPNVTFVTYGQIGHWTTRRIHRDIINFAETDVQ
jgi:dienelactone hydrolase